LRYAQWDLSQVELLDPHQSISLCQVYPLDKAGNSDAQRRRREARSDPHAKPPADTDNTQRPPSQELPPLLKKLQAEFAATGLPPAFVNKPEREDEQ
jgi:hypothetical protein